MTHFLSVQSSSLSAEGTQVSLHLCSMLQCLLGAHDKQGGRNWGNRCSMKEDKQKAPFRLFKHRFCFLFCQSSLCWTQHMLVTPAPIGAPMKCPPHWACKWEQRPSTYLTSAATGCWRSDLFLLLCMPGCSCWLSHPLYMCKGTGVQSLTCTGTHSSRRANEQLPAVHWNKFAIQGMLLSALDF